MIPKNITRKTILEAIRMVDEDGIPKKRRSTKYNLAYENKLYPPKYLISLANKIISGEELNPEVFGGGAESNTYLAALGFEIRGGKS